MARIACLWVRELPLAALLRIEPELRDRPLALVAGRAPGSRVVAASAAARAAGLVPGMTAVQARAACEPAVIRSVSVETVRAAADALADVARTISPLVEVTTDGTIFCDCTASAALCASEPELATVLGARAQRQGLDAWVGIASSKLAARIAAREGGGACVIPAAETRVFLAPRPVALLEPDERLAATLARWGIRRIGELAALPAGAVAHRLGPAGARLARLARGEDDEPVCRQPPAESVAEAIELDYDLDRLEPLLFVLHRLLERLTSRLALSGQVCGTLELRLDGAGEGQEIRQLATAIPTGDSKMLLTVIRADLQHRPPVHAVRGATVIGTPVCPRPTQVDLFRPSGPSPSTLAATLARLAALCGPTHVGAPHAADSHRPDAAGTVPFTPSAAGLAPPAAAAAPQVARLALRAFRPPRPLEVFTSRGRLEYVRGRGLGGRVVQAAGPWSLRGEWWTADPFARSYYDVELSDGGLYRLYRDVRSGHWLADGMYD